MSSELGAQIFGLVHSIVHFMLPTLAMLIVGALWLRGISSQDRIPSAPQSPAGTAGAAPLLQIFGPENVATAKCLIVQPVQELLGAVEKFGGHPTGMRRSVWPRCAQCEEPMTFLGQLRAGPTAQILFPTEGLVQMFVCSARAPRGGTGTCDSADPRRGASHVRFTRYVATDVTLGEDRWDEAALAAAVRRNTGATSGPVTLAGVEKVGREGRLYYPYLARQYTVLSVELAPSVRLPERPTTAQVAMWTAACSRLRVQVGGHYAWSRQAPADRCECGSAWETVLQLDPLDEVLAMPVAARISVQGCARRHVGEAFRMLWQAP